MKWMSAIICLLFILRLGIQADLFLDAQGQLILDHDSAERAFFSWRWLQSPQFAVSPSWLPLPFWLMGISIGLIGDVVFAPPVINSIFGLISLWLCFLISRIISPPSSWAPPIALALAAFQAEHLLESMAPSSDPIYWCLLLAGCLFALHAWKEDNNRLYCAASIAFGLACWARYEGWLFCLIFAAVSLRKRRWAGTVGLVFPTIWMGYQQWHFGHAFQFLFATTVPVDHPSGFPNWGFLRAFSILLLKRFPFIALGAVVIGRKDFSNPHQRLFALFALGPLTVHIFLSTFLSIPITTSHIPAYYLLLCPLWAFVLTSLASDYKKWFTLLITAGLAVLLVSNASRHSMVLHQRMRHAESFQLARQLREWSRSHFETGHSILVELPDELPNRELWLRNRYPAIWKTWALPYRLHFGAHPHYMRGNFGAPFLRKKNNPSLFDLPQAILKTWIQENKVRIVITQRQRGRKVMDFWPVKKVIGPYSIHIRAGDSLAEVIRSDNPAQKAVLP